MIKLKTMKTKVDSLEILMIQHEWSRKREWQCKYLFVYIERWTSLSAQFTSVAQSCPTLRPRESQHTWPPCPSPTPRVHRNSCPLSQLCHPAISSSVVPFSSCLQSLPASDFSNESTLRIRWPKYWSFSFSISSSHEHPGLISFRMDWLYLLGPHYRLCIFKRKLLLLLSHFSRVQLCATP